MSLQAIVTHSRILITVVEPDSALRFSCIALPLHPPQPRGQTNRISIAELSVATPFQPPSRGHVGHTPARTLCIAPQPHQPAPLSDLIDPPAHTRCIAPQPHQPAPLSDLIESCAATPQLAPLSNLIDSCMAPLSSHSLHRPPAAPTGTPFQPNRAPRPAQLTLLAHTPAAPTSTTLSTTRTLRALVLLVHHEARHVPSEGCTPFYWYLACVAAQNSCTWAGVSA